MTVGLTLHLGLLNTSGTSEKVLRWASVGGALTFDPHGYDDTATGAQIRSVYERLVLVITLVVAGHSWTVTWAFTEEAGP